MTAADDMKPYVDMQIMGAHHSPVGMILELGFIGSPRSPHRFVTICAFVSSGDGTADIDVMETVDPPAHRPRNRRGYTDPPTLAQHLIDQGDDRAERDREQTDWCDL